MNRGMVGMSGGFSGAYENQKPPRQNYLSQIPGIAGSKQKAFQPLRHQGRLGHALSNDRHNIDQIGLMPDANYKSAGEFPRKPGNTLFKSRSQAK